MLCQSILDSIGNTPLVRLNKIPKTAGIECNIWVKCEFLNPGGSVKDRIGFEMLEAAEKSGAIKPGDTLIEPSSGNTGVAIALAGAIKGYKVIVTMPKKMSQSKQLILEALGAKVIRTPTEAAWDSKESHIGVAKKLNKSIPRSHILDQYSNPENPNSHYHNTAEEILKDLSNNIDMLVVGAGTGGTLTGLARKFLETCENIDIIGVDPVGSILAGGTEISSYNVEGIGYDFIPHVLDRELVSKWIKTKDKESFLMAKRLMSEEGLLCGGSSGAAVYASLLAAKSLKKNQNCVVILPDGIRNYLDGFIKEH